MEQTNREHKSRLFSFLFGREENKKWTLSLYNAIRETSYTDPEDIQITTMEEVVWMGMKNDLSFIVADRVSIYSGTMNVYEQQSTFNPNMPIREFMYAGRLYDKYIHMNKLSQYSTRLMPLPIPKLVVFYNGRAEKGDDTVLRLSDSFRAGIEAAMREGWEKEGIPDKKERIEQLMGEADPDIEVKVRMFNINYGHNKGLMEACRSLSEYAWFVEEIRKNSEEMDVEEAIDKAMDDMPDTYEIKEFLIGNRAEVKGMCLTEYNEQETMELLKKEFREEGRKEGRKEGREQGTRDTLLASIRSMMKNLKLTAEEAMGALDIPQSERSKYASKL